MRRQRTVRNGGPVTQPAEETRDEGGRMAAILRYEILDTPPDAAFDRVAALAARLLDAPAASVAIRDRDRIWLKAAYGLDGTNEVAGTPGRFSLAAWPDDVLVVSDALADPATASSPLVTGLPGVRFYAAAPIVTADGHRLGTVNVMDMRPRTITAADLATLADLAAIVMDELELRLSARRAVRAEQQRAEAGKQRAEAEHEARTQAEQDRAAIAAFAATLQQTLLPPVLPAVPGLELACHYHPTSPRDIGGDFYDVFRLDARRWGFFLGDVCGKGAAAAALTSLARYTLRAASHHFLDEPVAVLTELNDALLADPAVDNRFCTALYGVLEFAENGTAAVTLAGGGHPPALHLTPGKESVRAQPVELPGGPLVGVFADPHFVTATVRMAPGSCLLLYTDGLTEARTSGGGLLDKDGLAAFFTGETGGGPVSATKVVADAVALLARLDGGVRDDVAMLALSVPAGP
ncbi:MAG: PP2C family protein-serine/threonine phosphatase [Trebonia sp.]